MSFLIAPSPPEKSNYGHYDDLGADFFDQFVTFETIDNTSSVESRQTENSNPDHASSNTSDNSLDWSEESWTFGPDLALSYQESTIYSEITGRAAISDSELLSLDGINLDSTEKESAIHRSLPSSPLLMNGSHSRKKQFVESMSKKMKKSANNFEKYLRSPIRKINSSPKTTGTRSSTLEHKVDFLNCEYDFGKIPTNLLGEKHTNSVESSLEAALPTPLPDHGSSQDTKSSDRIPPSTPLQEQHMNGPYRVPSSTDTNSFTSPTVYVSKADAPIWWNHASTTPMAQPSPTSLHINTQRATESLAYQLQNDLSWDQNEQVYVPSTNPNRPMLQMVNGTSAQSFAVESSSRQQSYFGSTYPHHQSQQRPNGHPRSIRYSAQYSPTSRRNAPPVSESDSPSPKRYQVKKRKTPRKERNSVPRTPSLGVAVDFVNFTPSDSKKILNGVAPSGSSKTKARREKEAMEKRRKLSQAAVRAVRAAGGDVESLVEQGLLV